MAIIMIARRTVSKLHVFHTYLFFPKISHIDSRTKILCSYTDLKLSKILMLLKTCRFVIVICAITVTIKLKCLIGIMFARNFIKFEFAGLILRSTHVRLFRSMRYYTNGKRRNPRIGPVSSTKIGKYNYLFVYLSK